MKKIVSKKIIVCPECFGQGVITKEVRDNYYESHDEHTPCVYCGGLRVVREIVSHESVLPEEE